MLSLYNLHRLLNERGWVRWHDPAQPHYGLMICNPHGIPFRLTIAPANPRGCTFTIERHTPPARVKESLF